VFINYFNVLILKIFFKKKHFIQQMISQYERALYDAFCYFEQRNVQNAIEPCAPKEELDW